MIRKPVFAGSFYPKESQELCDMIRLCFDSGPGLPRVEHNFSGRAGAIVPHAGYVYSGRCAAHAYHALAQLGRPSVVYILCPSHTGLGSALTLQSFRTPLGVMPVVQEIVKELSEEMGIPINDDAYAHEHAIEVQLPFLQYVYGNVPIVPFILDEVDITLIAVALSKKEGLFIASSDFMHYGERFGYVPFVEHVEKNIARMDKEAFAFIKKGDGKAFIASLHNTGNTICGVYPIAVLLETINGHAKMLCHYNSGELSGDYSHVVDYMSVLIT